MDRFLITLMGPTQPPQRHIAIHLLYKHLRSQKRQVLTDPAPEGHHTQTLSPKPWLAAGPLKPVVERASEKPIMMPAPNEGQRNR